MSLPARMAWVGCWAAETEDKRTTAESRIVRRIMLGLKVTSGAGWDKRESGGTGNRRSFDCAGRKERDLLRSATVWNVKLNCGLWKRRKTVERVFRFPTTPAAAV